MVTEATLQLSPVVGVPKLTPVAVQPLFVVAFTSAGAVMLGGVTSFITISWLEPSAKSPLLLVQVAGPDSYALTVNVVVVLATAGVPVILKTTVIDEFFDEKVIEVIGVEKVRSVVA